MDTLSTVIKIYTFDGDKKVLYGMAPIRLDDVGELLKSIQSLHDNDHHIVQTSIREYVRYSHHVDNDTLDSYVEGFTDDIIC
ncbi:MAG: hypothetical protein KAH32_04150 [Chlamydiia bacterium]|nr:hypothetical protein [Chlamydiia bacterium]